MPESERQQSQAVSAPTSDHVVDDEDGQLSTLNGYQLAVATEEEACEHDTVQHLASLAEEPSPPQTVSALEQLLALCGQGGGALPSMEALLGRHMDLASVRKIGEGTFGEAFKARRLRR